MRVVDVRRSIRSASDSSPEFHRNDKLLIDIARVEHRQDIRVLQFRRDPHFVQKFLMTRVFIGLGILSATLIFWIVS